MKIKQSQILHREYKLLETDLGDIYLFNDFVITEFKQGVDISFDNFYSIGVEIGKHFWKKPFGFIANRPYSYSINLKDAEILNMAFPNLKAYAIVVYSDFSEKIFEVENVFFKFNRRAFKSLDKSISWVEETLKKDLNN
ncbi:hypothetical protein [Winogradskyella flava]|uniref:STAS/SEC14 domain-containing protein n=1 Tax=Winogradskyella flava TaxID=1884876 RepID=A0A842IQM2_9FLAO|nr:hypothetical protein [Winogradskyella flava]MBC2845310.1 hypothetical protein [Winogradskyella flava]